MNSKCSSPACVLFFAFRERMEKKLNFDNYKEKFSMLLHVEELQMQKDIRNYDMKGVVFQQERGDRRFLILEASLYIVITTVDYNKVFLGLKRRCETSATIISPQIIVRFGYGFKVFKRWDWGRGCYPLILHRESFIIHLVQDVSFCLHVRLVDESKTIHT